VLRSSYPVGLIALVNGDHDSHASGAILEVTDTKYFYTDSVGDKYQTSEPSYLASQTQVLSQALPPGKHIEESRCILQSSRGVCFLYALLFMCYPDLSVVQLQEIIAETFQRTYVFLEQYHAKNPYGGLEFYEEPYQFLRQDSQIPIYERSDLYVLAVMEDFLFTDQGPTRRLAPEQRLQKRKTAGRRKTRRLHKRKPKK
jgi:hypothetical protein